MIAVLGRARDREGSPRSLVALNPIHAVRFFANAPLAAFLALGAVVLAVTGTEALYADMGHFGRAPIRRAWLAFVLPALVLNYFGQGALLLADPAAIKNPFYLLAPRGRCFRSSCSRPAPRSSRRRRSSPARSR